MSKAKRFLPVIAIAAAIFAAVFAFSRLGSDVYKVRNGSPAAYPDKTWEEALGEVCSGSEWKARRDNGIRYVNYSGKVKSSGEKLGITFEKKGADSFEIKMISLGGKTYWNAEKAGSSGIDRIVDMIFTGKL